MRGALLRNARVGLQRLRTEWLSGSLNVAIMMSINVELRTAPMIGLLQHYGLAK